MSYEPTKWKKGDKITSARLNKIENGIQGNDSEISDLKSGLSELNKTIIKKNYIEGYYISKAGQLVADPDYCVTEKIYMTPEMNNSGVFWYGTYDAYKTNVVSFTADDTMVDYWGGTRNVEYRAISNFGANVAYIRFTFDKGYAAKFTTSFSSDNIYTTYWQAGETNAIDTIKKNDSIYASSIIGKEGMKKTATSLATGVTLSLDDSLSIKKNKVYHLHTLIDSSFDTLYFGNGEERYSLYFKIDNTNVTFMTNGSEGSSLAHGLTLSTYIDVMLIVGERNTGTLIINTLSGVYRQTVQVVNGYKGAVFVRSSGCTITDVTIEFTCVDFRQPIWMFGDSYFTHTANDRWTYWLLEWGFGRCLLNGFPGEDSSEALPQVLDYLENAGTPKHIVWCMGMNDPDSGAVNASWLSCVETLISTCEEKGIEPILSTIPNVPSYTHTYKNAWVKTSGYRYIDFAKAVGAESAGSSWYTGCLSNDNTHPSEYGARLLCLQALLDVSELTMGNI